jgi:hypothetical protein
MSPTGNCEACWHLWSVHGPDGCTGKVYPSYSLTGEPCTCEHTGAAVVTGTCTGCDGTGMVWVETCTCGSGMDFPHERYCGAEQCPNGCPFNPPSLLAAKNGDDDR